MQIPILNGIYTDEDADFRTSYPVNMVPVPKQQGISKGYLRPAEGIVQLGDTATGVSRGAINWNDQHYRVMGTQLVRVASDGTFTVIGTIPGVDLVKFDYSFTYLSITADNKLYLYNGATLAQVTDPDLGNAIDHIWVDGYFMTTDGTNLVVTELTDPFTVLPTKYGSSEADPDSIKALLKVRNEPYAMNRYTIEVFSNIGGSGFPFTRISGAQIKRGTIGTHACCNFEDGVAFIGGGRNEPVSVHFAMNGNDVEIATREIMQILKSYDESIFDTVRCESKVDESHRHLLIHLPDKTLVYDAAASKIVGEPVWFKLSSGLYESIYRARDLVWCYNKWWVGDTTNYQVGYLTNTTSEHWGDLIGWEFGTVIIYNDGVGAIFHELELVALSGRISSTTADPQISTEYSLDGESWSMPKSIKAGKRGERKKRLVWLGQGNMEHWRIQKFKGTSDAHLSVARLEARIEPLAV